MAKPELRDHRKFLKLRRLLGEPTPHVMGYLECLWLRGYQTGNPAIGDELDVEAAAEYPGDEGKFAKAVVAAGFVDRDEKGHHSIHDLFDHAPKYVQLRMVRKETAPEGTTWDSITRPRGSKKSPKNGSSEPQVSSRELQNGENEFARTTELPKTTKTNPKDKRQETRDKKQETKTSSVFSSADAGMKEKPQRPRDLLFDAIAEVTGADPATAGPRIATVKKALLEADPPYTPDEVRNFGREFPTLCHWAAENGRQRPELFELRNHIGKIRNPPQIAVNAICRPPPKTFDQIKAEQNLKLFDDLRSNAVDAPGRIASSPLTAIEGPR